MNESSPGGATLIDAAAEARQHGVSVSNVSGTRADLRAVIRADRWCPKDVTDATLDEWIASAGWTVIDEVPE